MTPQQRLVQLCISWTLAISAKDILPMARTSTCTGSCSIIIPSSLMRKLRCCLEEEMLMGEVGVAAAAVKRVSPVS
jgi:hypothetical protein